MKKNKLLTVVSLFLLSSLGYAHEFWLEPTKFLLKINEKITINMMVGEDYQGEHSNGLTYKIVKLDHYSATTKEDMRSRVYGDSLSRVTMPFGTVGNHLIALNNTSKFIQLDALKFNDYLRSEGLDNVLALREQKGDTLKAGRERYQRCVKTLVQVGGKSDVTYGINTGMPLEIIPATNPYTVGSTALITFKLLFDNTPLSGALVLAWHMENGKTTHTKRRSNSQGEVDFPITKTGKWMISTVHMTPHKNASESDWQSYWGSYTFGYY
jgi:uncharacterized GH25 family protein